MKEGRLPHMTDLDFEILNQEKKKKQLESLLRSTPNCCPALFCSGNNEVAF